MGLEFIRRHALSERMLAYHHIIKWTVYEKYIIKMWIKIQRLSYKKMMFKIRWQYGGYFISVPWRGDWSIFPYCHIRKNNLHSRTRFVWLTTSSPLVPHICVGELGQQRFKWWLGAEQATSHYLNQCWTIVKWTLRNKFQWKFIEILTFSFKKICLNISSAKWRPFCPGENEFIKLSIFLTAPGCGPASDFAWIMWTLPSNMWLRSLGRVIYINFHVVMQQ